MTFDSNDLRDYPALLPPRLVDRGPRPRYRARAHHVSFRRAFVDLAEWPMMGPQARRVLRKFWHHIARIQRSGPLAVTERRIGRMRIEYTGV